MLEKLSPIYRWIAAAAGLLVAGFMLWYFSTIVLYILVAAVLGVMGKPLVRLITRLRIGRWSPPRWLAALLTLVVILIVVVGSVQLLLPVVVQQVNQLAAFNVRDLTQALAEPIASVNDYINRFVPENTFSVEGYIQEQISPYLQADRIQAYLLSVTGWIVDLGVGLFAVSFITFFFLKEDSLFTDGVVILFPARTEQNVRRAIGSSTRLIGRYFFGICVEMVIKLVCITVPLYFCGFAFNTALLIGIITAVLNVIPYIGPLIGAIIGCGIAMLLPVPGVAMGVVLIEMIVIFAVFQLLDNIVLQPYIYASSVKAHPLEIFLVILAAGYLAGIVGMLFAIPAYTVLRVFAKEFFNHFRVVQKLTEKI